MRKGNNEPKIHEENLDKNVIVVARGIATFTCIVIIMVYTKVGTSS